MDTNIKMSSLAFITTHPILWAKVSGAIIGSSIAVVFQPAGDTNKRLFARFIIGVVLGVVFSPIVLDWLKIAHTWDYWLAVATGCGTIGVLLLQIIFSKRIHTALENTIENKVK